MVAASASEVRSNAVVSHTEPTPPVQQVQPVDTYQPPPPQVNRQGATEPAKFNFGESAANALTWGFFGSMGNALFRDCCRF